MKRWSFLLLLIGMVAFATPPWASRLQVTGPAVRVDPALIDLGVMPQETIQRTAAWVHNIGTDSLRVGKIESDCGCTVANVPRMVLAPGDSMQLKISFNSRHYSGSLLKRVTIESNDPGSPKTRIKLKVLVKPLAVVEPEHIDLGTVPRGQTVHRTITLKAARSDSLSLTRVHLPTNTFAHRIEPIDEPDSTGFAIDITLRPDAPIGDIRSRIGLETNRTQRPVQVAVQGKVHGFFLPRPSRLSFGQFRAGTLKTATVRLEAKMPGQHQVRDVSFSCPGLRADVNTLEEGRVYEIVITATPEVPRGQLRETMLIRTDDPEEPELTVALRGNIKD